LEVDKIVIVNGPLQVNFEYGRKTVQARDIKIASISQVREQAKDLGLMDARKRLMSFEANEKVTEAEEKNISSNDEKTENKEFDKNLENKIQDQVQQKPQSLKEESKYVVKIPSHAKKEDLHDLKSFLLELETGLIEVYILLK
jgi:hypothetical protein